MSADEQTPPVDNPPPPDQPAAPSEPNGRVVERQRELQERLKRYG